MIDTAKKIVLSSLPEHLTEKEKKRELFLRFYKDDFDEKTRTEIIKRI